jgi:hypothetical protein
MAIKAPDTVSVTTTGQSVTGFDGERTYTLRNTGSNSLFYLKDAVTMIATGLSSKTEAELTALFCSELAAGASVIIDHPLAELFVASGSDGGSTTMKVVCGELVSSYDVTVHADVDIGDVHLLNTADGQIDPSSSQPANSAYAALDPVTPMGAVRKDAEALPEAIADGDYGALQTNATGELRVTDDTSSALITTVAGAVHVEDTAHTTADPGIQIFAVRTDTRATLVDTTADYAPLQLTSVGELRVRDDDANTDFDSLLVRMGSNGDAAANDGSNSAQLRQLCVKLGNMENCAYVDDADWSDGSSKHMLVGGLYQSTPQPITDGDVGPFQVDDHGNQVITIRSDDAHFGAVGAAADVDGVIHGQLYYIGNSLTPLVTAGGGGYVRQDSTGTIAKESGGNLASVKTNSDTLVTAGGGGYVRQDSTATIAKESGGNLDTLAGVGLTYSRVKIDNAALMTLLNPGGSNVARLHALHLVAAAAATVKISYDDDGAATNEVDLTGAMSLAQNGSLDWDFSAQADGCLAGAAAKFLTLTPSAAVDGYAVVSTASS